MICQKKDKKAYKGICHTVREDGKYPVSRPLYFYVKKAHVVVIPGIVEFLAEFSNDRAWGEEGYLTKKGLIPAPADERAKFAADLKGLAPLSM